MMREDPLLRAHRRASTKRIAPLGALSERGQALVEFALILPVFLLLVLGMIDFGVAYNDHNDLTQLAGEAARFAAVDSCGTGCTGATAIHDQVLTEADNQGLVLGSGGTFGTDQGLKLCFWFPPSGGTTGAQGSSVQAVVETNYQWLPFLHLSATKVQLKATATMRIETAYPNSAAPDVYSPDAAMTSSSSNCTGYTGP